MGNKRTCDAILPKVCWRTYEKDTRRCWVSWDSALWKLAAAAAAYRYRWRRGISPGTIRERTKIYCTWSQYNRIAIPFCNTDRGTTIYNTQLACHANASGSRSCYARMQHIFAAPRSKRVCDTLHALLLGKTNTDITHTVHSTTHVIVWIGAAGMRMECIAQPYASSTRACTTHRPRNSWIIHACAIY